MGVGFHCFRERDWDKCTVLGRWSEESVWGASIALFRGYWATIRQDRSGPEFTCRAHDQLAYEHDVEQRLIQSGKPTQNVCIERFNGRFRDACLNEHGFSDVSHARKTISEWRQDYKWLEKQGLLFYADRAEKNDDRGN